MDVQRKLEILADAAKYDASCASSGAKRDSRDGKGMGSTAPGMGICHSYTPDGRCVSLLKILLTNYCIYDCQYCVNRVVQQRAARALHASRKSSKLTLDFYRRNYIEGLFLSSGIIQQPRLHDGAAGRRRAHAARGAPLPRLHPPEDDSRRRRRADRGGRPLCRPAQRQHRAARARRAWRSWRPRRDVRAIRRTMGRLRASSIEAKKREDAEARARFAPAGQSTQMIVGADDADDATILDTAPTLYGG